MLHEDRRLDVHIDSVERHTMDTHASHIKFTMDMVEEMWKMLLAEVDRKIIVVQTELI